MVLEWFNSSFRMFLDGLKGGLSGFGQEFCQVLLQMQKVTPSLERLVRYINLSTDLPKRRGA